MALRNRELHARNDDDEPNQSAGGEANRILLASALSSMRIICPNKVSRRDWIIAVSLGCFVSLVWLQLDNVRWKSEGLDTCCSTACISQTRDLPSFAVCEVAADWHELT